MRRVYLYLFPLGEGKFVWKSENPVRPRRLRCIFAQS